MELALTIIAGLGVLLFLVGYLGYIISGFRHHFVTGVISILPILNIVTVPALWSKTSKKLLLSVLGVVIAAASWFFGADANIKKILFNTNANNTTLSSHSNQQINIVKGLSNLKPQTIQNSAQASPASTNQSSVAGPFANVQHFVDESVMEKLPSSALYKFSFENVSVDKAGSLTGRVVKVLTNKLETFEGRVSRVSNSSIFLQSGDMITVENEFPLANIKTLSLMVKKAVKK